MFRKTTFLWWIFLKVDHNCKLKRFVWFAYICYIFLFIRFNFLHKESVDSWGKIPDYSCWLAPRRWKSPRVGKAVESWERGKDFSFGFCVWFSNNRLFTSSDGLVTHLTTSEGDVDLCEQVRVPPQYLEELQILNILSFISGIQYYQCQISS